MLLKNLFNWQMHPFEQHSYLKSGIYPFQQVLQDAICQMPNVSCRESMSDLIPCKSNSPKSPRENLLLPPIIHTFRTFELVLPIFYAMD